MSFDLSKHIYYFSCFSHSKGVLSERLEQLGEVSQLCTYEDNNGTYEAENAIDGDIYTFQHTCNNADSWWRVDFGISASIEHVVVTDRANCQGGRLTNSLVEVLDEENNVVSALSIVDSNPSVAVLPFNGVEGTAVRVTHGGGVSYEDDAVYLTMAEVEVHVSLLSGCNCIMLVVLNIDNKCSIFLLTSLTIRFSSLL